MVCPQPPPPTPPRLERTVAPPPEQVARACLRAEQHLVRPGPLQPHSPNTVGGGPAVCSTTCANAIKECGPPLVEFKP